MMRLPRQRARPVDHSDLWRRLRVALVILLAVLSAGTTGYLILGLGFVDALYQTVITVSTVGYREIGEVDTAYKFFTIGLVLFGAGSVLYTIGVLLETLVEGRLTQEFGRRRMDRAIEDLEDHIVVCGWGQVGQAISTTLGKEGRDVVVIDRDEELDLSEYLFITGDATDDGILISAGIRQANALVVALDSPADNVYVTLSARAAKPDLFIVARATSSGAEPKLYQAGADRVVNPHELGGAHMAALVTQPNVAEYLDIAMHDRELTVSISEFTVEDGSVAVGAPLGECDLGGVTVLALRERAGRFVHHPGEALCPGVGDVLIALGTEDEHAELRRRLSI
jgi:voltage-gated potassium channel